MSLNECITKIQETDLKDKNYFYYYNKFITFASVMHSHYNSIVLKMNFFRTSSETESLDKDIYYYLFDFFRGFLNEDEANCDLLLKIIKLIINSSNIHEYF